MAISSELKISWYDYFTMSNETYLLKNKVADFSKDLFINNSGVDAQTFFISLHIDVKFLIEYVKENSRLTNDGETLPFLQQIKDKIELYIKNCRILDARRSAHDYSAASDYTSSDVMSCSPSFSQPASDDICWPGGVHVPVDIEVNIPSDIGIPHVGSDIS